MGGGGKSPTVEAVAPQPINTTTTIGSALDVQTPEYNQEDDKTSSVDKKKMGTRGLQIPLTSDKSTPTTPTAASTGIQI